MATSSILHAVYEHTDAPTEITESYILSSVLTQNATQTNMGYSVGSITIQDTTSTQDPTNAPLSYDDKLKFPVSYPWNQETEPDNVLSYHQTYHTAVMAGVLVSLIFILFLFRQQKRQKNAESILYPYLARFRTRDFRIRKSPLGGWNIEFGKELYNQVRDYWSGELPDARDAGTIVFDACLERSKVTSSSDSESGDTDSVSSSDDGHPWWQVELSHMDEEHEKMIDITSYTGYSRSLVDSQRKRKLLEVGISQFVRQQFAMDDIVLRESTTKGWTAIFCNRLAEGMNDADSDEIVDFSSKHEIVLPAFPISNPLQLPL